MSLYLPDTLREDFRGGGPGIIVAGDIAGVLETIGSGVLICIGDVVSSYCARVSRPKILVIDGRTRRTIGIKATTTGRIVTASNKPGTLSYSAWKILCDSIDNARHGRNYTIIVNGEEDMLALAAFDCSMPGDVVVYGLPGRGAYIRVVDWVDKIAASSRILELKPGNAG